MRAILGAGPDVFGPVKSPQQSVTHSEVRKASGAMRAEQFERIDRRTKKVVGIRWKFWVYDPERRCSRVVPVEAVPQHIRESQNPEEVYAYVKSQNAIQDTVRHRAKMNREWMEKYHDFQEYLDRFADYQKERAPNSWENDVYYLGTYAFAYFLTNSSLNNLNQWHFRFDEFRQWLKDAKPLKYRKERLSLNTQVKIIKALNRFLDFCFSKGWILQSPKCPNHKRGDTLVVTADDLIRPEEVPLIRDELRKIRPVSADLFTVLANTGMRINEAIGLSYKFVTEGHIDGPNSIAIHRALDRHRLSEYRGYICLESQPARPSVRASSEWTDRFQQTWARGTVPRKALKCRRRIAPEYFRYIPIFSDEAWNVLVDRWNIAADQFERGAHGPDEDDYLLFDGLSAAMFYNDLTLALQRLGLRHRSPHKLRHTFLTWFYAKINNDPFLAEAVGGHRERRDIERYSHLRELIGRERKTMELRGKRMKRVQVKVDEEAAIYA